MRTLPRYLLLQLCCATLVLSCKSANKQSDLLSEISGSADNVPSSLGKGFDSDTQTIKTKCVTGTPVWAGAQEATITYDQDLDFDSVMNTWGGGATVGAKLSVFDIKGAADFASKNSSDEFSSTISITNQVTIKKKVLDDVHLADSTKANLIHGGKVDDGIRDACGDEYFNTIVYGAELFINAKFTFASKEDRLEFKGNASVSLASIGELGGNLSHLSDNLKKNSKVSITARQVGGDVDKLSSILSAEVITCNLAEFDTKCLPMLTKIVDYAKDEENGFRGGLKAIPDPAAAETAKGWAQTRFISTPYENEQIDGYYLQSPTSRSVITQQIQDARDQTYDLYQMNLLDGERAATVLKTYKLTTNQTNLVQGIVSATTANKASLAELADTCLHHPKDCAASLDRYKAKAKPYDATLLNVIGSCLYEPDMQGTVWKFSKTGGSQLGLVRLGANHKIELYKADAADQQQWDVVNCRLRFKNASGTVTTQFDNIDNPDHMTGLLKSDNLTNFALDRTADPTVTAQAILQRLADLIRMGILKPTNKDQSVNSANKPMGK